MAFCKSSLYILKSVIVFIKGNFDTGFASKVCQRMEKRRLRLKYSLAQLLMGIRDLSTKIFVIFNRV